MPLAQTQIPRIEKADHQAETGGCLSTSQAYTEAERADEEPEDEAGEHLAGDHPDGIARLDLAQGQPADDRADRLAPGVPPGPDQERDEGIELEVLSGPCPPTRTSG